VTPSKDGSLTNNKSRVQILLPSIDQEDQTTRIRGH